MAGSSKEVKLSLKIMVDIKTKKLVYAEAEKEFVDFIFTLMTLPLSTVTNILLLNKKGTVGCLGALYKGIESFNTKCFKKNGQNSSILGHHDSFNIPLLSLRSPYVGNGKPSYVKEGVVYMVMDNLEVKQLSTALIRSHVRDFNELEEMHVQVGLQEAVAILKASLETDTVLTTVFLNKI